MFGTELLLPVGALSTVGTVFAEAIALYVLYGALDAAFAPKLLATIGGR